MSGYKWYHWKTSTNEFVWGKIGNYFKCENAKNVNLLIMNGKDDILVPPQGFVMKKSSSGASYPMPPTRMTIWEYANSNLQEDSSFKTPMDKFTKTLTYSNKVGTDYTNCYSYSAPNGTLLSANITFCTGTGGHLWWGALKRNPRLK